MGEGGQYLEGLISFLGSLFFVSRHDKSKQSGLGVAKKLLFDFVIGLNTFVTENHGPQRSTAGSLGDS